MVATQAEIDRVTEMIKPLQSSLVLVGHRFSRLRKDLKSAHEETKHLIEKNQFFRRVSERQKEQHEILASLEDKLTKQVGKNQILTVELGRPINLHRWRHLKNAEPEKWVLVEKVNALQKQVIKSTDKVTSQSSQLESKKTVLAKLVQEVSKQTSVKDIDYQLSDMKDRHEEINKEIKANELLLQQRADFTEALKADIIQLEKKRMEIKTSYIVSFINSH